MSGSGFGSAEKQREARSPLLFKYVTLAFFPAGMVSKWFIEQFCAQDNIDAQKTNRTVYEVLNERVENLCNGPTGLCITPHFVGACNPHWDVRATGVMVGLTPGVSRCRVYKAIHEGIACELALNTEVLEEVVGPFDRVRLHGGNAKSPFTVQLRADVTGKIMETPSASDAVCRGAAILAGIGTGVYRSAEQAVEQLLSVVRSCPPDPVSTRRYSAQLRQYRLIYPSLEAVRNTDAVDAELN